ARLRSERLIWQQHAVRSPQRSRDETIREVRAEQPRHDAELTFEHRDVDELSASRSCAGVDGRQDAERGVHPGGDIRDRHAGAHAVAAGLAGDADHPALGLHDEIERRAIAIWSVLTEPRHRAVHDAWIPGAALVVADPEFADGADAQVLEHDVRAIEESKEDGTPFVGLEV